jgi:predicted amidohydrolase YtcJ
MRIRALLGALIALSFCLSVPVTGAQAKQRVKLVLFNGKVFTVDAAGTLAQAVAVDGERIVAVGSDAEIRGKYQGAKEIDLHGRLVTPGFNDAHLHFQSGGLALQRVVLQDSKTLKEAQSRIAAKVKELPPGAWVTGRGWDHTLWGGQWPTRQDLDAVAPNNPVFVIRVDGHVGWANTLAIKQAGVTRDTKAPEGGEFLRDAAGDPSGIFKETTQALIASAIPAPTREENLRGLDRALQEARRYGITSIQDNSGYETIKLYAELLKQGKLTVRVGEWQAFDDPIPEIKRQRAEFADLKIDPFRIRLTSLKGYVDGTLGSRTAAMLAPFSDDPHNSGIPRKTPEELTRMIVERDAAGFQICLHAIGDRANRMALDGFEAARKQNVSAATNTSPSPSNPTQPPPSAGGPTSIFTVYDGRPLRRGEYSFANSYAPFVRHRIEHAQVIAPSDFARFRDLGVIASMQPSHAISDKRWAQDRLGEYRVQGAYAWHMMRSFGVHVPFGTDWPVEPINPYLGLYAAVTRMSTEGDPAGGWWPQERITIADAIRCYTAESAYASFEELEKGQIAPGMLADLTVHSQDLLTIAPAEILKTEAVMTILGGEVVYEAKGL